MNIEKQLETAVKTNHLVLVVFYADWSPHYEWIGPVLRTYEKRTVELIRVNAEENRTIADAHIRGEKRSVSICGRSENE